LELLDLLGQGERSVDELAQEIGQTLANLEGVAKRMDRPYVDGRVRDWINVKRSRPVYGVVVGVHEIAVRVNCEPSNVTAIVDRLEARELIHKVEDSADRRVRYVALTARGRRVRNSLATIAPALPGLAALFETEESRLHDLLLRVVGAAES
jgi:DNA-binding MarR family transcriptional regulator